MTSAETHLLIDQSEIRFFPIIHIKLQAVKSISQCISHSQIHFRFHRAIRLNAWLFFCRSVSISTWFDHSFEIRKSFPFRSIVDWLIDIEKEETKRKICQHLYLWHFIHAKIQYWHATHLDLILDRETASRLHTFTCCMHFHPLSDKYLYVRITIDRKMDRYRPDIDSKTSEIEFHLKKNHISKRISNDSFNETSLFKWLSARCNCLHTVRHLNGGSCVFFVFATFGRAVWTLNMWSNISRHKTNAIRLASYRRAGCFITSNGSFRFWFDDPLWFDDSPNVSTPMVKCSMVKPLHWKIKQLNHQMIIFLDHEFNFSQWFRRKLKTQIFVSFSMYSKWKHGIRFKDFSHFKLKCQLFV